MGGKRNKPGGLSATAAGCESFISRGTLSQESLALFLAFQFKDSALFLLEVLIIFIVGLPRTNQEYAGFARYCGSFQS